jgi:hypothetical protein
MESTSLSISEFLLTRYHFTADQKNAIARLDGFMHADIPCFLLKGYAGTGKTFLTKGLVEYFRKINWTVMLMAPTGRAARILATRTGEGASTIHKGIYNLNVLDEVQTFKGTKEKYKFRYGLNKDLPGIHSVIIIDEASMVSDNEQENDFFMFGSGRLLKDLMTFTAPNNESRRVKLIFIGDNAQLPPVGDKISGALSQDHINREFHIQTNEYQLREIVRQGGDSGILQIAGYLRDKIAESKRRNFKLPDTTQDVHYTDGGSAIEKFLSVWREKGPEGGIMLHYRNKDAFACNMVIREVLFPGCDDPQVGDRLIITSNNYNYKIDLLNGTFVTVTRIYPDRLVRSNIPSHTASGEDVRVTLTYRRVDIEVPDEKGTDQLTCLLLETYLQSPEASLSYEEHIASYIDFKIRHPDLKPKTSAFKDAIRADPYFNAVRVKYGYAITGHKSQGGEWDTAFVNMDVPMGVLSDDFLRWTYTAVTRAAKTLWIFNVPSRNPYANIRYEAVVIGDPIAIPGGGMHMTLQLTEEHRAFTRTSGLVTAAKFLLDHYYSLLARLHDSGIHIRNRMGYSYQEQYVFESDGRFVSLGFWYNAKGQFTRTLPLTGKPCDETLLGRIMELNSRPVSYTIETKDEGKDVLVPGETDDAPDTRVLPISEITFPDTHKPHEKLYLDLSYLLADRGIHVSGVDHFAYKERYHFRRGEEKASVDFTYDGNDNYSWVKANAKSCNSQAMLDNIAISIDDLKNL